MKLFRLKDGKYLPNLVAIDPGAVAAPVHDKNAFISSYLVRLPDDVVTGEERAAVRVKLTPPRGTVPSFRP